VGKEMKEKTKSNPPSPSFTKGGNEKDKKWVRAQDAFAFVVKMVRGVE